MCRAHASQLSFRTPVKTTPVPPGLIKEKVSFLQNHYTTICKLEWITLSAAFYAPPQKMCCCPWLSGILRQPARSNICCTMYAIGHHSQDNVRHWKASTRFSLTEPFTRLNSQHPALIKSAYRAWSGELRVYLLSLASDDEKREPTRQRCGKVTGMVPEMLLAVRGCPRGQQ